MKTLLLSLLLCGAFHGFSQAPAFKTEIIGSGAPVLVIEGFTSIDSSWETLAEKLGNRYQFHLITLAGFGEVPAGDMPVLGKVKEQLIQYIVAHHLFRPVIIGQDIGAMIALWIAGEHPYLFSGILCVDNFPVASSASSPSIERLRARNPSFEIAHALVRPGAPRPADFQEVLRKIVAPKVTSTNTSIAIAHRLAISNPLALRQIYSEAMQLEPYKKFHELDLPVLILSSNTSTIASSRKELEFQYESLPHKSIIVVPNRKFVFYGDPLWFTEQVKNFLINGIHN